MADPLSEPAVKATLAVALPAVMDVMVGAAGAAEGVDCTAGVTDVLDDAAPSPCAFMAISFT